jgi:hypothetical protein
MKLEIKHLAPYLPYRLKMNYGVHNPELIGIYGDYTIYLKYNDGRIKDQDISNYKPILYPLEYLTKEIEVNREKFVPSEKIAVHLFEYDFLAMVINRKNTKGIPFWVVQKLFEWHFDVFGLIPAGLAIDINTLKD